MELGRQVSAVEDESRVALSAVLEHVEDSCERPWIQTRAVEGTAGLVVVRTVQKERRGSWTRDASRRERREIAEAGVSEWLRVGVH